MRQMNLAAIDMNLLVALDALLGEAHVRRAGERIGLSQPATSHALARLRALLGDPLLVRSGASMTLTPKAERLRAPLAELLQQTRCLLSDAAFEPLTTRRTFTFMMPDIVGDLIGPLLVERVAAEAPGIHLNFTPWRGPALLSERDLQAVDFLITSMTRKFSGFISEPLYVDRDVVAVRSGHPARKFLPARAGFLAQKHIAIVGTGEAEDVSEAWLRSVGLERQIALSVPTYLLALRIAARTDLVAFVPRRLAASMQPSLDLALIEPPVDPGGDEMILRTSARLAADPATPWMQSVLRGIVSGFAPPG